MKILFVEQFSEIGGGQRNLLDLLPAVRERGWKAVVAAPGRGRCLRELGQRGRRRSRSSLGIIRRDGRRRRMRCSLRSIRRGCGGLIARADCDLISVGGARLLPGVAMGAGGRAVIFQAQHYLGDSRALRVARRAIRHAGATVVANSRHVAGQFGGSCVVYNGVEEIPFGARPGKRRIGVIGRIAPMKGQADFLRAAREVPDATFVICGSPMFCPPEYVDEVYRLAEGLAVEFLGGRGCGGGAGAGWICWWCRRRRRRRRLG